MKIALINGVKGLLEPTKNQGTYDKLKKKHLENLASPGTKIEVLYRKPSRNVKSNIESCYDELMVAPNYCKAVIEAEKKGFDAAIIGCFGDPGLYGARESVRIPVIGTGEASILLATCLGDTFSIITPSKSTAPNRRKARILGVESRLASVRTINMPIRELYKSEKKAKESFIREAQHAVKIDNAAVIIPGCGHFSVWAQELQQELGIPVIDPAGASLKLAETLVGLGASHSILTYPRVR